MTDNPLVSSTFQIVLYSPEHYDGNIVGDNLKRVFLHKLYEVNSVIIDSGSILAPVWCQAITYTNTDN